MGNRPTNKNGNKITRREFVRISAGVGAAVVGGAFVVNSILNPELTDQVFIAKAADYDTDPTGEIIRGLTELKVTRSAIVGKRILVKPNVVENRQGSPHITTHPMVIHGVAQAFLSMGAKAVTIGEGPGHVRDTYRILYETHVMDMLEQDKLPFVDLNRDEIYTVKNGTGFTKMKSLMLPATLRQADIIVSLAKMKTHHWAGVTLSMKNLFGLMPGSVYGWPKNVLHQAGIVGSILDINATVKPHLAIVDGIVGMEGDGPIMGDPKPAGVLVMGRNPVAVDATCTRIMGVDPFKIQYLSQAANRLGTVKENNIAQRGETIEMVRTPFALREDIPAQKVLMS